MRVRGIFVGVLVLVVVAIAGWYSITMWHHRVDQRDLRAATSAAHQLRMPPGAVASKECRGDGLVACWTTPTATSKVAHVLASTMQQLGSRTQIHCDQVRVGTGSSATTADECSVIARYGSRAAAVFVSPHWEHTPAGNTIVGSLISVSAA